MSKLDAFGVEYSLDEVPQLKEVQVFFLDQSGVGVELNFDSRAENK